LEQNNFEILNSKKKNEKEMMQVTDQISVKKIDL
jgi:hypothetical protein